jgi:hypothetical protein
MTGRSDDGEEPRDPRFEGLAEAIDGKHKEMCEEHYDALTQEHQLTSRIAQALDDLRNQRHGLAVEVTVQELPDKGSSSLEKPVGADIYVAVVRRDDPQKAVSKGLLAQTKWDDSPMGDLRRQEKDMLDRSDESYVWIYGPEGISVIPAQRDRPRGRPDKTSATSVGDLVVTAIECHAGDPNLGPDLTKPRREAIRERLEALAIPAGIMFEVTRIRPVR